MKRQADTKRRLPFLLGGVAAAVLLSFSAVAVRADDSIKVAGYGGATWDAITRDYLVPLKAKTGLDVKLVTEPNLAKLKAMVEAASPRRSVRVACPRCSSPRCHSHRGAWRCRNRAPRRARPRSRRCFPV